MAKRHFILTPDQTAALRHAELRTKDGPTRTRYQAVRLYGSGYQVPHIREITSCSRTSLMDWCRRYRTAGITGLGDGRIGGNRAKLTSEQRHLVRAKLHQYTPRHVFGPETATAGSFGRCPISRAPCGSGLALRGTAPVPTPRSWPPAGSRISAPRKCSNLAAKQIL